MSTAAVVMMILAMVVIWGGLAAALVNLGRTSDDDVHRDL